MNAIQVVNEWLHKLAPGDAGMVLNQHGQCQLISNGSEQCIVFVPQASSTEFHLFQDLVPLPSPVDAGVYEEIMKLNLPGQPTRSGAIGVDPQTRNLVFAYSREIAATDIKTFCAILENFLDAARENAKLVKALLQSPGQKARGNTASRLALLTR